MRNHLQVLMVLFLSIYGCEKAKTSIGDMEFPNGAVQHVVLANEITWKPCPPNLPSGCEMAVLEGNPQEPNFFTVRFKINGKFIMPPHTHPKDERVTVLEGKAYVAFGKDAKQQDATIFDAGDYYVNSKDAVHTVWADSSTVLQITGIGPWKADFINN